MARLRRNLLAVKNFLFLPDDPSQPLTRFDLIRLKNWMLIGIYLANAISYILMTNLIFRGGPLPSAASLQLVSPFGHLFRGLFFGLGIPVFALIYERPIRRTLNDIFHNRITPPLLSFIQLSYLSGPGSQDTGVVFQEMRTAILTNSIFFIIIGISVTLFAQLCASAHPCRAAPQKLYPT
jgi:hypothetical protein